MCSTWKLVHFVELIRRQFKPISKVFSVEKINLKQPISCFHAVVARVYVAIQSITRRKVNHGSSLIFLQVPHINLSMDIQHISTVQPYVSKWSLIVYLTQRIANGCLFRHVKHRTLSIQWHVHVDSMIMWIQLQKHWLTLWLVSMICYLWHSTLPDILFFSFAILYCTDHREHGNRIIREKLLGSRLFSGIPIDPETKE